MVNTLSAGLLHVYRVYLKLALLTLLSFSNENWKINANVHKLRNLITMVFAPADIIYFGWNLCCVTIALKSIGHPKKYYPCVAVLLTHFPQHWTSNETTQNDVWWKFLYFIFMVKSKHLQILICKQPFSAQ